MSAAILRVGLTGNIAAGKSTVSARMKELGCRVLDLDAVAHECLQPGQPSHEAVVNAFGDEFLRRDGTVDRAKLGERVFADDQAREVLEGILHPAVRERERVFLQRLEESGEGGIIVTEAALLYETGGAERYHRMVVVVAPDESRLRRLRDRGLSAAQARQRMSAQMDQQRKARMADYVIDNDGTIEEVRAKAGALVERLQHDLQQHAAGQPLGTPEGNL